MEPRNVIMWALLPVIVVLVMSTGVQAQELRDVPAKDILEQIENGEDVYLDHVHVTGVLDLSKIELETVNIERSEWQLSRGLEEELKVVESKITIKDSVFGNDVDFHNAQFRKTIDFQGTAFSCKTNFRGVVFSDIVNFSYTSFSDVADFFGAGFNGNVDFLSASFYTDADFSTVNFKGYYADFVLASFNGDADFSTVNFKGYAGFEGASFNGDANFGAASFNDYADFQRANFNGDADFQRANFSDLANFDFASFNSDAFLLYASFNDYATFWRASFYGYTNVMYVSFSDGVNFKYVSFSDDVDFSGSNFNGNAFFEFTKFDRVFIGNTNFTSISLRGSDFKCMEVSWSSIENALVFDGPTYAKLIKNFRDLEQFEDADDAYYQYRRLSQANKGVSFAKLGDVFMWVSCGYGVKPHYTIGLGVGIILVFALIYWLGDSIRRLKESDGDGSRVSFWDAFYFSMITFTTVGYGDWYPTDKYRKFVMVEGLVGWLTLSLFLVTLANVMIRP